MKLPGHRPGHPPPIFVILPAENEQDVRHLPDYVRARVGIRYVSDIKEVLELTLVQ